MNKKELFFLLLVFGTNILFGQQNKSILDAPSEWNSEMINFPLSFAPEIDFVGFEDIRFAPGWSDPKSEAFWSYHFTWFVERKTSMTVDFLAQTFNQYYDGLIQAVLKENADQIDPQELDQTLCLFLKTEQGFVGKMRIFDAFFTKDYINLHVKVREQICTKSNKQLVSFDLSPKHFDDPIWELFQKVKVVEKCE